MDAASGFAHSSTCQLINPSIPTTLAFGFVSPWILWGLALGGVPILIQWLHRRNYTQRVWAAMRFLRAATKSQSRRLRFESLLLLLIRTLILVLVALALAEPFLESAGWLPQAKTSVHRVLLIDTSLSMQYETDGRPVSERAREAARSLVAESQPGDSFQIVTIDREGRVLVRQPAFDPDEVSAEIDQLNGTEEIGSPKLALDLVQGLLQESPAGGQPHVTIISDFQRSNWWPDAQSERMLLQQALADLAQRAELSIVHVGPEEPDNMAISDLQVEPALLTVSTPAHVSATIRNHGEASVSLPVELVENDRVLQTKTIEIPPGGEADVEFTTVSRDPDTRRLEVRLPRDGLAADNHRFITVDVREELAILLVNGRESGESLGGASDFVEVALAPTVPAASTDGRINPGAMAFRPVVVNEAEFARTDLADFDGIFLCDVPFLSESESAQLDQFVRSGGGLIIGLGNQIQPEAYNQWQSVAGGSILPAQLIQVRGEEDPSSEPFHFAEPTTRHPIVEPFFGNPQAGLTTANIYRYYQTRLWEEDAGGDASDPLMSGHATSQVALAYDNGAPAIIERAYGVGRVLLVTTSLDDRWGSWALWPSFLPMVHRMVRYAVTGLAAEAHVVGDSLRREYPVQTVGMPVTVQLPDGRRSAGRSSMERGATLVAFEKALQSGIYRFVLGPPMNATELIAVNVDSRESDLRTLDERELTGTLLAGIDAQLRTPGEPNLAPGDGGDTPGLITGWLLFVALMLLLVEQVMAFNARYGLIALAASPLLVAGFLMLPMLTVALLLAGLGGLISRRYGLLKLPR